MPTAAISVENWVNSPRRTVPATSRGGHTPTPARTHRLGSRSSTAYKDRDGRLPPSGWPPPLGATGQAARSRLMSWHGIQVPGRSHSSTTTLARETSGGERPTQPSVAVVGQKNGGPCRENQRFPQITGLRPPDRLVSPTMIRCRAGCAFWSGQGSLTRSMHDTDSSSRTFVATQRPFRSCRPPRGHAHGSEFERLSRIDRSPGAALTNASGT